MKSPLSDVEDAADPADEALRPPAAHLQFNELSAGLEYASCLAQLPLLITQCPSGAGQPVMVLPGFLAGDGSTRLLRWFLDALGYKTRGWGQGISTGPMKRFLLPVRERLEQLAAEFGEPVRLVGWSRGGVLAREVARDCPELVQQVVTLASPVRGGSGATSIRVLVEQQTGLDQGMMQDWMAQRSKRPISVPVTAIYSRGDGVVAWAACIDELTPQIVHREVTGTHSGMGSNAMAYRVIAEALASG